MAVKRAAREPRPLGRALAVVTGDARHVGDNESDARTSSPGCHSPWPRQGAALTRSPPDSGSWRRITAHELAVDRWGAGTDPVLPSASRYSYTSGLAKPGRRGGRCSRLAFVARHNRLAAGDPANRWIIPKPLGVVHVLGPASRPNTDRRNMPTRACRQFLPVRPAARVSPARRMRLKCSLS